MIKLFRILSFNVEISAETQPGALKKSGIIVIHKKLSNCSFIQETEVLQNPIMFDFCNSKLVLFMYVFALLNIIFGY